MKVIASEKLMMRPATLADAERVTALLNACSMADEGVTHHTVEDTLREWQTPIINLERDMRVIVTPDDQIVGYAEVFDYADNHVRISTWGRVHPDYRGRGLGTQLMEFIEDRCQQSVPLAPAHARVAMGAGVFSTITDAQTLFVERGFNKIREFYQMRIELDQELPIPQYPAGITIRIHNGSAEDDRMAYEVIQEAFKDHWGHVPFAMDAWLHLMKRDEFDPSVWYFAIDEQTGAPAGACLCDNKTNEDPNMAWVDDLGILRAYRKRGIALALLHHTFREFKRRGKARVGLGVDATSLTGATKLYERAGMRVAKQWNSYEKELRPGEELSTRTLED